MTNLERHCSANNQYTRRECFEITGFHKNMENKDLEKTTIKVLEKIDINIDPANMENCH